MTNLDSISKNKDITLLTKVHMVKAMVSPVVLGGTIMLLYIVAVPIQQHANCELPDVQAGFRKGRGPRDQIANIRWIMEKVREFQKNIYF